MIGRHVQLSSDSTPEPVRVLLVDDHLIFRAGLKRVLEGWLPSVEVVAEAANGDRALELAAEHAPDVVLLDVSMPGLGGYETASELKRRYPKMRVVMLTVHPEDQFAVRCLRAGADGYLVKHATPEQLVAAIRKVAQGGKYISPALAEILAFRMDGHAEREPHESLSDREFQVLRLIGTGKSSQEMAAALQLSVKTIGTYRARILVKMKMRTNAELAHYVIKLRLGPD
jgi:two-component system invasion response regulator UvrY